MEASILRGWQLSSPVTTSLAYADTQQRWHPQTLSDLRLQRAPGQWQRLPATRLLTLKVTPTCVRRLTSWKMQTLQKTQKRWTVIKKLIQTLCLSLNVWFPNSPKIQWHSTQEQSEELLSQISAWLFSKVISRIRRNQFGIELLNWKTAIRFMKHFKQYRFCNFEMIPW